MSHQKAVQIPRNVRAAGTRAAVSLIELVRGTGVIPHRDWADSEALLNLGGRERAAAEYRDLLSWAGSRMTRVVRTASPLSAVEARAV